MAEETHHVFLIPGFFGFTYLGELTYFAHVRQALLQHLRAAGLDVRVHAVATHPTASIEARASRLAETVAELALGTGPIHLVGHSTGGLDARLLVTPQAGLKTGVDVEGLARRCQSVITVATPHHGTPLAPRFATLFGQQVLRLLSLGTIYILSFGHLPLMIAGRLGAIFVRLDDRLGLKNTVMDQLFEQLIGDFTPERRTAVKRLLEETRGDQGIVTDLDPVRCSVFNGETPDRDGVRYASIVTMVPRPRLRTVLELGLHPYMQATHAVFAALYRVSGKSSTIHMVAPGAAANALLRQVYGELPDGQSNDGVVPTLSQLWGELIHAATADHLDVVGHFNQPNHNPPHYDWLTCGAGFDRAAFDDLWKSVARFIARPHGMQ